MNTAPETKNIANQESYRLATDDVEAYITRRSAMLGPVTFHRSGAGSIQPYAVAPWNYESTSPETPTVVRILRGDFFCSAFGGNDEAVEGVKLPVHGDSLEVDWDCEGYRETEAGVVLKLRAELPNQRATCHARTALMTGENMVYQRHDIEGGPAPINPGHHATLQFPDRPGSGRLAFSPFTFARTYVRPAEQPALGGYSTLASDMPIDDLSAVPCLDGSLTDLTLFPARRGFDDIAILCADPSCGMAWSSVTFPVEGYVWFSLRNPEHFPATLLWISNGGRYSPPWNGRHRNVMGIEDMMGFYHEGLAASARHNLLNDHGIPTTHLLHPDKTLKLPYIQGVARVPEGFERVADIQIENDEEIRLIAGNGRNVKIRCRTRFLRTGRIDGLLD